MTDADSGDGSPSEDSLRRIEGKLDLQQFARCEMDLARSALRGDLEIYKKQLTQQNWKHLKIFLGIMGVLTVAGAWRGLTEIRAITRQASEYAIAAETTKMREEIEIRIDGEFKTPRITELIQDAAKYQTESQIKQYVAQKIEADMRPLQSAIQSTSTRLAEANSAVKEQKILLADGLQMMTPRLLSSSQFLEIARAASQFAGQRYDLRGWPAAFRDDADWYSSTGFFRELNLALESADWKPSGPKQDDLAQDAYELSGVRLSGRNVNGTSGAAHALHEALEHIDVEHTCSERDSDVIRVVVGNRLKVRKED